MRALIKTLSSLLALAQDVRQGELECAPVLAFPGNRPILHCEGRPMLPA
jgi:hypothetical protein